MQRIDLKRFRKERHLTQKSVSEATGYQQCHVSAIENGKTSAPNAFINKLQQVYGVGNIRDYVYDDSLQDLAPVARQANDEIMLAQYLISQNQELTEQVRQLTAENKAYLEEISKLKVRLAQKEIKTTT